MKGNCNNAANRKVRRKIFLSIARRSYRRLSKPKPRINGAQRASNFQKLHSCMNHGPRLCRRPGAESSSFSSSSSSSTRFTESFNVRNTCIQTMNRLISKTLPTALPLLGERVGVRGDRDVCNLRGVSTGKRVFALRKSLANHILPLPLFAKENHDISILLF